MASGLRYKWQGSMVEFGVDFTTDSPGFTVTAISQANPAHVTATNTLEEGQVVKPNSVVGMTELNDNVYIAVNVSPSGFDLRGVDSTNYSAYVSGGNIDVLTFVSWCELTGYNRTGGTAPDIDATTICSVAVENETGLRDFGAVALDYRWAPITTVQEAIEEFADSGEQTAIRVTLPKNGGSRTLIGSVQQTSEQASNGTLWNGSMNFRVTGRPYDQAAA